MCLYLVQRMSQLTWFVCVCVILISVECPDGSEEVKVESDEDFTTDWEFTHAVENLYKYVISVSGNTTKNGCNAYVSTKTDKACFTVSCAALTKMGWLR